MHPNELAERTNLIGVLAETFRQTASKSMLAGYTMALEDIPTDRLKAAVRTALRTCKFMSTPVELRELAGEMKLPDRAVKAFMALEQAVTGTGGYSTVDFDDRFINATVRALGGWVSVCETPADEFDKFLKAKFEKTYCALVAAGVGEEQAAPLQGRHDRDNSITGYQRQTTKEITTGLPMLANNPPRIAARPMPVVELPKRLPRPPAENPKPVCTEDPTALANVLALVASRRKEMGIGNY